MTALHLLPHEIILAILSYLPLKTIETVAWTFSHPITDICMPLLQPLFKARRNRKCLTQAFGDFGQMFPVPHDLVDLDPDSPARKTLGLSRSDVLRLPPSGHVPDLDYMNLCGDFKWLHPLPASIREDMIDQYRGPAITGSAYDDLISSAERAGVTLPPAFLTFIQNEDLQIRFPSWHGGGFRLPQGGLVKIPRSRSGGRVGYTIDFLAYLTDGALLYLEPGKDGLSCILTSQEEGCPFEIEGLSVPHYEDNCPYISQEDREESRELDLGIMPHDTSLVLEGIDFEAYLVNLYYNEVLCWVCSRGADSVPGLNTFVRREFVEKRETPKRSEKTGKAGGDGGTDC